MTLTACPELKETLAHVPEVSTNDANIIYGCNESLSSLSFLFQLSTLRSASRFMCVVISQCPQLYHCRLLLCVLSCATHHFLKQMFESFSVGLVQTRINYWIA